ncbi:T7SS effector LXG polymorphic toxin [Enterococcus sp. 5H]|uniref:T7SS effector LXG polymorphic toxin n=1 Tax=Enterococcus sp. 5H TaxID=1229490 RepID=UPI0023034E9D|nr:T7SS effector LXG polymorphic toxin [Enterococcus sp. 5H]MDA9472822.1 hypothetical protein [Enterococcus sp. 5H]
MGLKFVVSEAQTRSSQASQVSNQAQQAVASLQQSIQSFLSAPLSSKAYDSAKNYFMVAYTPICQSIIMTAEALTNAHKKFLSEYQATVSGSDMDEDKIQAEIDGYQDLLHAIDDLIRLAKTPRPDLERRSMNAYQAMQTRKEKLEKFRSYSAQSASFFSEYESSQQELNSGLAQVKDCTAWNASTGTFDITRLDMSWAKPINERWKIRNENKEKQQKELEAKMGLNDPKYEIRTVLGQYGEDTYEIYVYGILDEEATRKYNLDLAIAKRDAILNSELSTSDKIIGTALFLVGVTILTGGASAVITSIVGIFEGTGSVLVTLSSGATVVIPAIAVNKDALVQTAEGSILAVGGVIAIDQSLTIMASGSNSEKGSYDRLMEGNVDHASEHMHPSLDPAKSKHSQFNFTDKKKFADILAEAWKKKGPGVSSFNKRTFYDVDLGKIIGTNGEKTIRIVVDELGKIITAFPK